MIFIALRYRQTRDVAPPVNHHVFFFNNRIPVLLIAAVQVCSKLSSCGCLSFARAKHAFS